MQPLTATELRILNSASRSGSVACPLLKDSETAFKAIIARGEAAWNPEQRLYLMTERGMERLREHRERMQAVVASGSVK